MIISDPKEIEKLRQGGKILAEVLNVVAKAVKEGVSALELDKIARQEVRNRNAIASFYGYRAHPEGPAFPASICVSVNDEVVHGIPSGQKILKEGDIVGLDLGILYQGLYTDAAITVPVGRISQRHQKLIETAQKCLDEAIKVTKVGTSTGDIGQAIEKTAKASGFQVVRELVGHGVGGGVHEDPEIPCFGKPKTGAKLKEGAVIAIEPMVNAGDWKVFFGQDGWTIKTADGWPSAHFEHTVLVTSKGCEILTQLV